MKKVMPPTSIDAYKSLDPSTVHYVYERIKYGLTVLGEGTYEDLSKFLGIDASRIWKRLKEMSDMGIIYRPGNRKVLSSGRSGFVWKLVNPEIPTTIVTEKAIPGKSVSDYSRDILKQSNQV